MNIDQFLINFDFFFEILINLNIDFILKILHIKVYQKC